MDKLLNLKYYFSVRPDPNFQYTKLTLAIALLLLLVALAIQIFRRKYLKNEIAKKMLKRYPGALFSFSVALLVILMFREAGLPIFSMRIWGVLWILAFAAWIAKNALTFGREYRERHGHAKRKETLSRYLPQKKR